MLDVKVVLGKSIRLTALVCCCLLLQAEEMVWAVARKSFLVSTL